MPSTNTYIAEGREHQRRHRPPAAAGDVDAARARRRSSSWRACRASTAWARPRTGAACVSTPATGEPAYAQAAARASWSRSSTRGTTSRSGAGTSACAATSSRCIPPTRTYARAHRAGRRQRGAHLGGGSDHGSGAAAHGPARALPGQALRHARAAAAGGARRDPRRAGRARRPRSRAEGKLLEAQRHPPAHRVRPRDARPRSAPARASRTTRGTCRAGAGRAAGLPDRLLPGRLPARDRRVARHRAADRRHVRGRPLAQADAGRLRLPAAVGARQPAAALRRVRGADRARRSTSRPRRREFELRAARRASSSSRSSARPGSSTPSWW